MASFGYSVLGFGAGTTEGGVGGLGGGDFIVVKVDDVEVGEAIPDNTDWKFYEMLATTTITTHENVGNNKLYYLCIGGGGGGGGQRHCGGGGGGSFPGGLYGYDDGTHTAYGDSWEPEDDDTYVCTVGLAGICSKDDPGGWTITGIGTNGGTSTIKKDSVLVVGDSYDDAEGLGGGGGGPNTGSVNGANGGCGGGSAQGSSGTGGTGYPGYDGGTSAGGGSSYDYIGGGGGGMDSAGVDGASAAGTGLEGYSGGHGIAHWMKGVQEVVCAGGGGGSTSTNALHGKGGWYAGSSTSESGGNGGYTGPWPMGDYAHATDPVASSGSGGGGAGYPEYVFSGATYWSNASDGAAGKIILAWQAS